MYTACTWVSLKRQISNESRAARSENPSPTTVTAVPPSRGPCGGKISKSRTGCRYSYKIEVTESPMASSTSPMAEDAGEVQTSRVSDMT